MSCGCEALSRYRFIMVIVWAIGITSSICPAQELGLRAFVNREVVSKNQQFTLTIEISGPDVQSAVFPELPDLSGFADFMGSSTSQNFQLINGKMSTSKSSINYYSAFAEGSHKIPALSLKYKDKTFRTDPIEIRVVSGGAQAPSGQNPGRSGGRDTVEPQGELEGNIFLMAEPSQTTVYQNEPIVVSFKIYTRVEVSNYTLAKMPGLVGFWSEDFELPEQPATYEENINGKRFLVAEIKKVSLFPTVTGEKTIEPMEIECEVRLRQRRNQRDIFDRFFDDGGLFGRRVRTHIASEPLNITVKPLPVEGKPDNFSGAVGKFEMKASLDKQTVPANEAITLTFEFKGVGNIKILPEPKINFPPGFEVYEPEISQDIDRLGNRISGTKTFEYVLIPRLAGKHRIKPASFSYFDPSTESYKTIKSPEFVIEATPSTSVGAPMTSGLTREEIKLVGRDIRFIKEKTDGFSRIDAYFYRSVWFGLLLIFPIIVFGTALAYRKQQGKMAVNVAYARSRRANQFARKRLSTARKFLDTKHQPEFYSAISNALMGFIADKFNLAAAGLVSDDIRDRLKEKKVAEDLIGEVMSILNICDFQRFSPSNSDESNMRAFYDRTADAILNLDKAKLS